LVSLAILVGQSILLLGFVRILACAKDGIELLLKLENSLNLVSLLQKISRLVQIVISQLGFLLATH